MALKTALLCAIFALAVACAASDELGARWKRGKCACSREYRPVCAKKSGRWLTYDNNCSAVCDRAKSVHDGECPSNGEAPQSMTRHVLFRKTLPCACPYTWQPVCGSDGKTHANEECAACEGITETTPGECERLQVSPCICTQEFRAVCGLQNGERQTFSNGCVAKCEGATDIVSGECPPKRSVCACGRNFSPVCANGVQYSNACLANCSGVSGYTQGRCDDDN